MAVHAAALGVVQTTCIDCARARLVAHEHVVSGQRADGRVTIARRVTVLEGCGRCEGDSVIV